MPPKNAPAKNKKASLGAKLRNKIASLAPAVKAVEKKVNPRGTTSFPKKK